MRTIIALLLSLSVVGIADAKEEERRILKARDVDSNQLSEEYAKRAEEKRLESIRFLRELLSSGDAQGERKAEMILRLADLYFEQGRYLYLVEMAGFDKEFEACFNNEACDSEKLVANNDESRDWQEKSIKLYQQILRTYPRYARADEATYYLGAALQDIGQRDEAIQYFIKLTKQYQDSQYVPDAHVNIGEYYFDNNNAYKALLAYKKATAYRDSEKYAFSLYKLGWCYYNVGEYSKGIETMKQVVAYSMALQSNGNASKLQLQEEALKDLVRFFADAGEMEEAYEYFNKLGKKELIRSMLKRLANMYSEQGKFEQTVQTYRRLIAENPQSSDNPEYQHEIITAYNKMGKKQETLAEIERLRKTYGKESAWARANASNQDAIDDASDRIEKNLRTVAINYHNQAKKLGTHSEAKLTYGLAYQAYTVYINDFPQSEHAYMMRYNFAELLYKVKKFDEAYVQYMAVVALDDKGKHSRFCAESAIFAADEMVKQESKTGGGPTPGDKKEAQPLTEWEQRLVDACGQYATLYPNDKKLRNIIYKSAYLLYNKYRFEEAAEQFKKVIAMDPRSKEAETAANLILDSFVVNEDFDNLKKNSKFYFDQEGLGSADFKKEVYGIYRSASFKVIEVKLEQSEDKGQAAESFIAFYEEFKADPDAHKVVSQALNNAAVYLHNVKRLEEAMAVRHILVDDPQFTAKTPFYYTHVSQLGYDYETIATFDKAIHYYELQFSLYPKGKEALEKQQEKDEAAIAKLTEGAAAALYSAALFRTASGDWQKGIANYERFIAAFPDDERLTNIKLTIAKIWEDHDDAAKAGNAYYKFYTEAEKSTDKPVSPEFTYFARLHYARALEKQDRQRDATKLYQQTVELYKKYIEAGGEVGGHTEFVAEMMFILAEPQFDAYAALEITGAPKGSSRKREDKAMKDSLGKKAAALMELEKTYTEVVKTGAGEWGLASLVSVGKAYENMGESFKTSHIPYYLTEDQIEIYQMQLEDQVYRQTEKAVVYYDAALGKSYELTLYNENTQFSTRRLGELRPDDYPGLEEELLDSRYTSAQVRTFDFETTY